MHNTSKGKIIPFPSVSKNMSNNAQKEIPDRFQNEIDDFLREMGYIEQPQLILPRKNDTWNDT
jgi:hypothetical protein